MGHDLVHAAQGGLHHAAGGAEDLTCAGTQAERSVKIAFRQGFEIDACLVDHARQLLYGKHGVHIQISVSAQLRPAALKLLGSAGGLWARAGAIKQKQIDFVRRELDAFCGKGKPVFLVIHNAVESLLARQTNGHYSASSSCLIDADALYPVLKDHPDLIVLTGHVHHGFGGGAGYHYLRDENYGVIDLPGFKGGTIGYSIDDRVPVGTRHPVYFLYLFGHTLLLRAADPGSGEWLTAYDQTVTLPEGKRPLPSEAKRK